MAGSYKQVPRTTTLAAAIADGFSELESLAEECRELVDNASDMSRGTQRIQTFEETADTLESLTQPEEPPAVIAELAVAYSESVHRSKRHGPSRAVRCSNGVAMLTAAKEAVEAWMEESREDWEDSDVQSIIGDESSDTRGEVYSAAEQLASDLDDLISSAEGCEFPGMFG
jgi:hypothetical protein